MNEIDKKRNEEIREASGRVKYTDPLTTFFYLLLRNSVPAGEVEEIVREVVGEPNDQEVLFSNGWLAEYAHNLAESLHNHIKNPGSRE